MHSIALATALHLIAPGDPSTVQPTPSVRPLELREIAPLVDGAPAASIVLDLPLVGCVELQVAATTLVTDDFRLESARVDAGKTIARTMRPTLPHAYAGSVAGIDDSRVFIGLGTGAASGMAAGFIAIGDETWWISSGNEAARRAGLPIMLTHDSALANARTDGATCFANDLKQPPAPPAGEGGVAGGGGCREFRIAIDTDTEYTMSAHAGNTVAAAQYALILMGASSLVYDRDVNIKIPVCYLRLWTGEDPWTQTEMGAQLGQYRDHWVANMGGVPRDMAHHIAGRGLGGGVAWVGVSCLYWDWHYALSSGIGYGFPYPLIDHDHGNWEPMVIMHEMGHNFGAPHTHDHVPPAAGCGANDCTLAWDGTIMSYCHICNGGMSNISLKFHPYSIASMNAHLASTSCSNAGARVVDDATSTIENSPVTIEPLANDAFVNCATVSLQSADASSAQGGSVTIVPPAAGAPPSLRYTPAANFSGVDSFNYSIVDSTGATSSGKVFVTVRPVLDRTYLLSAANGVPVNWYALAGDTPALPDFSALTPYAASVLADINVASTGGNFSLSGRADLVAAVFEGYVHVPTTGVWTFASESDDGSRVFIDGQLVVNNDGLHGMVDRAGQIALEWGFHRFRVEFFENFGGAGEIFRWEGPGTPRAVVPASALFKLGTVMQLDLNGDGEVGGSDIAVLLGAWGPAAPGTPADFDRSGTVDASDMARLLSNWGP
ncbi:MAG: hypothetical protein RIT24_1071 [Planctomycetota bacterium]